MDSTQRGTTPLVDPDLRPLFSSTIEGFLKKREKKKEKKNHIGFPCCRLAGGFSVCLDRALRTNELGC